METDEEEERAMSVKGLKESWQRWSTQRQEHQRHNPSGRPVGAPLQRGEDGYGRPPDGSLTQQRGRDAQTHVGREVDELCRVIREMGGERRGEGGRPAVEFGRLFERYVTISNKVVGVLLRARRQGRVQFQGEMLWQGRDDHVLITLLQ